MISTGDIVKIAYSADLTDAGLIYVRHVLSIQPLRRDRGLIENLRRLVSATATELAFRRYLAAERIPFGAAAGRQFSESDHYDVVLDGHRCDVRSFLISHSADVDALGRDASLALEAPALVPIERHMADGQSLADIYVFGLVAASPNAHTVGVMGPRSPTCLIHPMPRTWATPRNMGLIGPVVLKSESVESLVLDFGGRDMAGEDMMRSVELPSLARTQLEGDFQSLAYIQAASPPAGRIGVHANSHAETYVVQPDAWGDIWLEGSAIYLLGWMTREEFGARAKVVPQGQRVFQFDRTRTRNLAVPVSHLKPLCRLPRGMAPGRLLPKSQAWT
jgi:hypothetical protein